MNTQNFAAGAFTVAVGAAFASGAIAYGIGSVSHMEAGFFPLALGLILITLGLALLIPALWQHGSLSMPQWRSVLWVLASIVFFILALKFTGLIIAGTGAVLIACRADPDLPFSTAVLLSIAVAAACWLIFIFALGLSIPAFEGAL